MRARAQSLGIISASILEHVAHSLVKMSRHMRACDHCLVNMNQHIRACAQSLVYKYKFYRF